MSDYLAYLANCTLSGIDFTSGTKNGKSWRFRNLIRLNVDGFELELHQDPHLSSNVSSLKGQRVKTTDLYVRNVGLNDVQRLKTVIDNVCDLLSFATESRVLPYGYEYPAGSGQGSCIAMLGTVQMWRPPFDDSSTAKRFVELCYPKFLAMRDRRKLNVVINYIHHSVMQGLAEEVKIGLGCITFENLRHNWAVDTGYPFIDGYFREKVPNPTKKTQRVGIERHLREMFTDVGMGSNAAEANASRVVSIRNEVLHTGLYGDVQNEVHFDFIESTLREYLLRLLGFSGQFYAYKGGSSAPITIP